jgi:hypothetical protein
MLDYEHRTEPLLPFHLFLQRLATSAVVGLGIVAFSLLIGMVGYHFLVNLGWMDAFLNASMLLGGMGPIDAPKTAAGKLFSGLYSLYCGFAVLGIAGVVFAPVFHRFLHRFHLEGEKGGKSAGEAKKPPRA